MEDRTMKNFTPTCDEISELTTALSAAAEALEQLVAGIPSHEVLTNLDYSDEWLLAFAAELRREHDLRVEQNL
jgi:hypothetical protein